MKPYGIVVLSRYPQYCRALLSSIQRTHKTLPPIVVVRDRHTETFDYPGPIEYIDDLSGEFVFSRNANRGILFFADRDVILCNDDMICVEDSFFDQLAEIGELYSKCGILSPLIDGGVGNPLQRFPPCREWSMIKAVTIGVRGTEFDSLPVCFPCVWISRATIDCIGKLDENFIGYGAEDNDYCIRARKTGWKTMITRRIKIRHGSGGAFLDRGQNWSLSFAKEALKPTNQEYLKQKHSV